MKQKKTSDTLSIVEMGQIDIRRAVAMHAPTTMQPSQSLAPDVLRLGGHHVSCSGCETPGSQKGTSAHTSAGPTLQVP